MISHTQFSPPNSFIVHAQPKRSGFFGLTELEAFTRLNVEPYLRSKADPTLIMDFSAVKVWDIAAVLWLGVALHHYRHHEGFFYLLRLPEGTNEMIDIDRNNFDKSADYLRRWRFDKILRTIDTDIHHLLVPEQADYFDSEEPRRFYLPSKIAAESGILQSLLSRSLAEIRELSDPSFTGSAPISPYRISQCIREFQAERFGDILNTQCGIEKRKADLFSDHLITEALLNVQEHPNATLAFIAISMLGSINELIISVVDNGDSIPNTIYPRYQTDNNPQSIENGSYNRYDLSLETRAEVAHHATKPHVTRKTGPESVKAGMGLTYIKTDSVTTFSGKLIIVTDGMHLTYSDNPDSQPKVQEWNHCWRGNLLRISIPLNAQSPTRKYPGE